MKYNKYIVKKRFKGQAIDGYINLPYGTICEFIDGFIFFNDKRICAITSQNAFDYFWGYDTTNPEREINRQELTYKLFDTAPKDDWDALSNPNNTWNDYGELSQYGFGMYYWKWDNKIFDLSIDEAKYLINCIEKGETPSCFK